MFCMQRLNDGTSAIEALLCGHSFHQECVERFLEVTGKRKDEACPLKCHQSNMLQQQNVDTVVVDAEAGAGDAGTEEEDVEAGSEGRDSEGDEAMRRIS